MAHYNRPSFGLPSHSDPGYREYGGSVGYQNGPGGDVRVEHDERPTGWATGGPRSPPTTRHPSLPRLRTYDQQPYPYYAPSGSSAGFQPIEEMHRSPMDTDGRLTHPQPHSPPHPHASPYRTSNPYPIASTGMSPNGDGNQFVGSPQGESWRYGRPPDFAAQGQSTHEAAHGRRDPSGYTINSPRLDIAPYPTPFPAWQEAPALDSKHQISSSRGTDGQAVYDDFNGRGLDEEEALSLAIAESLSVETNRDRERHSEAWDRQMRARIEQEGVSVERERRDRVMREREEEEEEFARALSLSGTAHHGGHHAGVRADEDWIERNGWVNPSEAANRDDVRVACKEAPPTEAPVQHGYSEQDVRQKFRRTESDQSTSSVDSSISPHIPLTGLPLSTGSKEDKPLPPGPKETAYAFHPPVLPRTPPSPIISTTPMGPRSVSALGDPIELLPGPSTLQIIAPTLSQILRDLISLGPLRVEPSPEAFARRTDEVKDPSWECRCWLWAVKCKNEGPVTRRDHRMIIVLELVELEDWRSLPLQGGNAAGGSATAPVSTSAAPARVTPRPPAVLRVDDGTNPILPDHVSSEVAFADLGSPLVLPFHLETLVERIYSLQKMAKVIAVSAAVPEPGSRAHNALRVWELLQKYPGPGEVDSKSAKHVRKEPLLALGRRISNESSARKNASINVGEAADDGLSVHGRYSKTAAIRKATSKVLGKISGGRAHQMDDEREEWITPFVTNP